MAVTIANTDTSLFTDFASSPQSASVAIGAAASDRLVFVYLFNVDGGSSSTFISGVTIGGITATTVGGAYFSVGSTGESAIYWAKVPTGTTATLSISFTGTPSDSSLSAVVYRVVGADTTSPISDSNADGGSGAGTPSAAITIPVGGALLAGSSGYRTAAPPAFGGWTNATTDQTGISNTVAGFIFMDSETALSSSAGATTVTATWFVLANFLSLVAINPAPPYFPGNNRWPQLGPILAQ